MGDKIDEGDPIATIETDKASMALEYQDEGVIRFFIDGYFVPDLSKLFYTLSFIILVVHEVEFLNNNKQHNCDDHALQGYLNFVF